LAKEKAYEEKIVKLILIKEGIYDLEEDLIIKCPISIHGAAQDKTIFHGGLKIQGTKEAGKNGGLTDMTVSGASDYGLFASNGLSFSCTRMTFTQCGRSGVFAYNTKGRLINCVITQCGNSGISCGENALIELEGSQTKVDGNGTSGYGYYGLETSSTSSIIHLLFPLTKESVSTNNHNGQNYGGGGIIETVESF
jgi:hypothetical protein